MISLSQIAQQVPWIDILTNKHGVGGVYLFLTTQFLQPVEQGRYAFRGLSRAAKLSFTAGNPNLPPKSDVTIQLVPDRFPIPVECGIHRWMKAYLWALDHPFEP